MSDRLHDLHRQRALAQEQVAWLDREIAAEIAQTGAPVSSAPLSPAPSAETLAAAARRATNTLESALPADAEKILAQYQTSTNTIRSNVKKGCFLYLALAFTFLAFGLIFLYVRSRAN